MRPLRLGWIQFAAILATCGFLLWLRGPAVSLWAMLGWGVAAAAVVWLISIPFQRRRAWRVIGQLQAELEGTVAEMEAYEGCGSPAAPGFPEGLRCGDAFEQPEDPFSDGLDLPDKAYCHPCVTVYRDKVTDIMERGDAYFDPEA